MSKRKKPRLSAEEKSKILKKHFVELIPVSQLCEDYGISPATFYNWQKKLFENAPSLLADKKSGPSSERLKEAKIKELEARIAHKDDVLREAVEALVMAKKPSGENSTGNGFR